MPKWTGSCCCLSWRRSTPSGRRSMGTWSPPVPRGSPRTSSRSWSRRSWISRTGCSSSTWTAPRCCSGWSRPSNSTPPSPSQRGMSASRRVGPASCTVTSRRPASSGDQWTTDSPASRTSRSGLTGTSSSMRPGSCPLRSSSPKRRLLPRLPLRPSPGSRRRSRRAPSRGWRRPPRPPSPRPTGTPPAALARPRSSSSRPESPLQPPPQSPSPRRRSRRPSALRMPFCRTTRPRTQRWNRSMSGGTGHTCRT
mmetsp:Transcript_5659/g.10359  ORF Transcript_5659/g.10359 Transcript_5659/m.10359 type:complete len:252 (+) Transcript_5659:1880-2635(+)